MKLKFLVFPTTAILVILFSSLLSYHAFSSSQSSDNTATDPNPSITLILPDQEYVLATRDLDSLGSELVIPTHHNITSEVSYDSSQGILVAISSPQDYVIDTKKLRQTITSYVDNSTLSLKPSFTLRDRHENDLANYNLRLNKIYRSPLTIILKDGVGKAELNLDSLAIRNILVPTSTQLNIPPEVDRSKLINHILSHLSPKQKKYFNPNVAYQSTRRAIHSRFLGEVTPVILGIDDGPTSQGQLADKYLEIDLSQQKMYFFISHSLFKTYRVSTGAEYPTPVGEFHILNKAPKAFSDIYNVWMPYWMGFKYAGDVGAYLGLHEIAYALNEKGKPVYNHGYYIGDMMTGGCVAMEPKDSREIYNLSDVGMLIRIVK